MTIVYTTNTGSTKRYAELLSEKTGYPCVELSKADLPKDEEVIFFGWVMLSSIQGLAEAREKFNLKAVCSVGMMGDMDKDSIIEKNAITEPFFAYIGAFDVKKLKGMHKMLINMMLKAIKSSVKSSDDPASKKAYEMLEKGFDMVNVKHLGNLLEFLGFETEKEEPQEEGEQ